MDTSVYQAACESFKHATSTLEETLSAIESHLVATAKNHRETLNVKSSLQVKLSQMETKLKVALDELSIQRSVRNDTARLTERVTELQMEVRKTPPFSVQSKEVSLYHIQINTNQDFTSGRIRN